MLPEGWAITKIGDLLTFEYGKGLRQDKRDQAGSIPVYGSNGIVGYHSAALVDSPSLIIGRKGTAGAVHRSFGPSWPIDTTYYVIPPDGIDISFVFYLLGSLQLEKLDKSTAIPGLNRNDAYAIEVAIPPTPEQRRIVEAIEELYTQLDAGVAELKQAQFQLKRYRQAVLKAAVDGELTREWREAHRGEIEPASVLLERILKERRQKWEEEQLAVMRAKGTTPKDDSWKRKYREPEGPDAGSLPDIPNGWIWVALPQIGELNRGKSKHRPRDDPKLYGGSYPFIQTGDVRHANGVLKNYSQTYNEEGLSQSRLWPSGTLCITIAANIADTAILGFDSCFPDSIVGFLSEPDHCDIRYIELFFRTVKSELEKFAPATAQKNINLEILSDVAVLFPPHKEQCTIVHEVETRLSIADKIESEIDTTLAQAGRLRQSILKQAFEGKLVHQDPNDEPAQDLLERIKVQKKQALVQLTMESPK